MVRPETAPPLSARTTAFPAFFVAAAAERRFARTDIHMPIIPEIEERNAPSRNATAVCQAVVLLPEIIYAANSKIATTIARTAMVEYCRFRKASAPSRMAAATSAIFTLPVSALSTCRAKIAAKASATRHITEINTSKFNWYNYRHLSKF